MGAHDALKGRAFRCNEDAALGSSPSRLTAGGTPLPSDRRLRSLGPSKLQDIQKRMSRKAPCIAINLISTYAGLFGSLLFYRRAQSAAPVGTHWKPQGDNDKEQRLDIDRSSSSLQHLHMACGNLNEHGLLTQMLPSQRWEAKPYATCHRTK